MTGHYLFLDHISRWVAPKLKHDLYDLINELKTASFHFCSSCKRKMYCITHDEMCENLHHYYLDYLKHELRNESIKSYSKT